MFRYFVYEKETKNTIRFSEVEDDRGIMIGTLYIQKDSLEDMGYEPDDYEDMTLSVDINVEVPEDAI